MKTETAALIRKHLGHLPRLPSTPMATQVCRQANAQLHQMPGVLPLEDGLFLLSLIEKARPKHVIEVGVLAGGSTLLMLKYFSAVSPETTLTGVDALDYCYFDPTRKLGFLVFDQMSPIPATWTLLGGYGAATFHRAPQVEHRDLQLLYDFAFIDAHHGHPWPVLDALCLLPFIAPSSWIALHDVTLTLMDEAWAVRGPQYLLQEWPLEACLAQDPDPNIGAIRLSGNRAANVEHLMKILEIPWEYGIAPYWEEAITTSLQTFLTPGQIERLSSAFGRYRNLPLAPG